VALLGLPPDNSIGLTRGRKLVGWDGRADGGSTPLWRSLETVAYLARNWEFESIPLQQRVGHEPHRQNRIRSRPVPKVRIQLSPPKSQRTFSPWQLNATAPRSAGDILSRS